MSSNILNVKECSICKEKKIFSKFYPLKTGKHGIDSWCKKCHNAKKREESKGKRAIIFKMYNIDNNRAIKDNKAINYTKFEFEEWVLNQSIFIELYNNWENSNYQPNLKPRSYRIDVDSPFELNNIGLATSEKVIEKRGKDRKSGADNKFNSKISKSVLQYEKNGTFIKKFHSIRDAERHLQKINNDKKQYNVGITGCCKGNQKTAFTYIWKYDLTPPEKIKFGTEIEVKHLNNYLIEDIENILGNEISIDTEKENLIKCRIGQGKFRDQLIKYWKGCSVTKFKDETILVASHIKPWRSSSDNERLDPFNGLLLTPNLDKLFDKGYISFDDIGKILISNELSDYKILAINRNMQISLDKKHQYFLQFHRENIYIK